MSTKTLPFSKKDPLFTDKIEVISHILRSSFQSSRVSPDVLARTSFAAKELLENEKLQITLPAIEGKKDAPIAASDTKAAQTVGIALRDFFNTESLYITDKALAKGAVDLIVERTLCISLKR